jgi:proteasome activator subunit 4
MLSTFLPKLSGSKLDSVLAMQSFFVHFVPLSHPQEWLPAVFALWEAFNSTIYDDQWLDMLARLAERHVDPHLSHPRMVEALKDTTAQHEGLLEASISLDDHWAGIRKDVGIFTDGQFSFIMSKCLHAMGKYVFLVWIS